MYYGLLGIADYGNAILTWIQTKAEFLVELLPRSPFRRAINLITNIPYMEYIAWFLPLQEVVMILMWWGSAITIYYAYMIILRWVKAIE